MEQSTNDNQDSRSKTKSESAKQLYHKPQLSLFGNVRALTLSAGMTSTTGDNSGNNGMDKTA